MPFPSSPPASWRWSRWSLHSLQERSLVFLIVVSPSNGCPSSLCVNGITPLCFFVLCSFGSAYLQVHPCCVISLQVFFLPCGTLSCQSASTAVAKRHRPGPQMTGTCFPPFPRLEVQVGVSAGSFSFCSLCPRLDGHLFSVLTRSPPVRVSVPRFS